MLVKHKLSIFHTTDFIDFFDRPGILFRQTQQLVPTMANKRGRPRSLPPVIRRALTKKGGNAADVLDSSDDGGFTVRQLNFILAYLQHGIATEAARAAGYTNPTQTGSMLLKNPAIAQEIQRRMDKRSDRLELTADRVLRGLDKVFSVCLGERDVPGGDPGARIFEPTAAVRAGELMGRHLKLFTDKIEVNVTTDDLEERLNRALAARRDREREIEGELLDSEKGSRIDVSVDPDLQGTDSTE